ncbi:response regulator [Terricaulis silvestris]|uniref:Transcriptional regulatory protein WalR n=1 Tax=Terricaulis silvestris TaxID=2686094 RepID=A0A6I6MQH4_9CAUL|nr:response regulator [Terricaulis silvestris]QGZ93423.1 Transcriptional regulatory protein WalR [Terricaulis silvestris]
MTKGRICLIDDDSFIRDALALGLTDGGYDVMTAPGAAAGLDLVARQGADAIVTDLNMPGTSGAQLIAEARIAWPDMPIVAISGEVGANAATLARSFGANAYLQKPFSARTLIMLLEELRSQNQS